MTMDSVLATLRRYELVGIENNGREIGRGSYASVLEMNYQDFNVREKSSTRSFTRKE